MCDGLFFLNVKLYCWKVCVRLLLCSLEYASLDDGSLTPALVTAYRETLYLTPAVRPEITVSLDLQQNIYSTDNYRPGVMCNMETRGRNVHGRCSLALPDFSEITDRGSVGQAINFSNPALIILTNKQTNK